MAKGWTGAALAIHSILRIPTPMLLKIQADEHPPIFIDFRHDAFICEERPEQFPDDPSAVSVETEQVPADAPPLFSLPGQSLDKLLWHVGSRSFDGAAASWRETGSRYKLRRWPNFTELKFTLVQMQMTSFLSTEYFTADELALVSGARLEEAERLINSLTLMDAVIASSTAPESALARTKLAAMNAAPTEEAQDAPVQGAGDDAVPPAGATSRPSLFARLRERLGR